MSNTFGRLFRVSTWGESHGAAMGAVVDGCPPRLPLSEADIQTELDRRRPGQSRLTTQRREADRVEILSGVHDGQTLGTSIGLLVRNADARSKDYSEMAATYRPSHADYTYDAKYGIRAVAGGGRASARETVARVAAGAIARKVLAQFGIEVLAWVERVADIRAALDPDADDERLSLQAVEATPVRCPEPAAAERMIERIDAARKAGDSLGGVVCAIARGVPPGLGEPVFGKLDAELASAMLGLPAAKGFELGSGFAGTEMSGSEHNDVFYSDEGGRVRTRSNRSGGIQGGISNGERIVLRVAFKPTATILRAQDTIDTEGNATTLSPRGRHDPCVLPRAVPIVEAMMALVLADHVLRHRGQCG
ncbi:chorismate synthase [Haliangium ochraceum]|uniref:Chorismate synthase n=1 Tax=Haliangium ochraceum (strain DSM 14365 / JCM 11303 / SMP-2) TaxID=502025 RepID=D0LJN6_HALO1|nr:chorismate synthase [Haliangium ochraceum]ACY16610.1 chorismate synthase [Haliangium ochraceum DSM 14365]